MKRAKYLGLFLSTLGLILSVSLSVNADGHGSHWSYGGDTNPTQWGRLGHDFALCETGRDQSPIDIDDAVVSKPSTLAFNYSSTPLEIVNNGHTIQVNYDEGSSVSIDEDEYELLQFHFHTPSEHTQEGVASAMEMHLVHRNEAGDLAVVGVMLQKGEANPAIDTVWANIPAEEGTNEVEGIMINAADLLPDSIAYYSYAGSLTTPPCSERVRWNVLKEPIQVSEEQIDAFEAIYQVNARPVQPTNGRMIELHEEE